VAAPPPGPAPIDPALLAEGERVYGEFCAQCHLAGEGTPGLNPPLTNSAVLLAGPEAAVHNILRGSRGNTVINGQRFTGIMSPLDGMSDEEIAAVVTYVRRTYAKSPDPAVTPEQVAELR
jgi:mono/diheme cytochrome c family protein